MKRFLSLKEMNWGQIQQNYIQLSRENQKNSTRQPLQGRTSATSVFILHICICTHCELYVHNCFPIKVKVKQGPQDTQENLDQKDREVNLDGLEFLFQALLEKEDSQDSQVRKGFLLSGALQS